MNVISYDDLIVNKRAINRKMEREDVEALEKIRKSKFTILPVDKKHYKFNRDDANER